MTGFHERFLARLPLTVLRSVAHRLGVEGADELEREALTAALLDAPGRRAAALGQSLRRLVGRLPRGVLRGSAAASPGLERSWRPPSAPPPAAPGRESPARPPAGAGPGDGPAATPGSLEFETLSMVDVLLRQGHVEQARDTLQRILAREPGNGEARRRLDDLQGGAPRPGVPSAHEVPAPAGEGQTVEKAHPSRIDEPVFRPYTDRPPEPFALLDFEEPPLGYGRIYAGLLTVEPTTVYAYWEVTHDAVEAVRKKVGDAAGRLTLRFVSHHAESPPGGATRDVDVDDYVGEYFFLNVRPGSRNRLAVGVRARNGQFEPVCHTGIAATPTGAPSADAREVWLEVEAPHARAPAAPQPIRILGRTAGSAEDALLGRARRIGLGGLPEEAQRRLLARLHDLLRSLTRPGALPTSPGVLPTSPGMPVR
jgi:hypothetical protein